MVRSRQFALARVQPGVLDQVLFTVPVDRTAIVKDIVIYNNAAVVGTVQLNVFTGAGNARVFVSTEVQGLRDLAIIRRFVVLHEGQQLRCSSTGQGDLHLLVSGALLAGDPS